MQSKFKFMRGIHLQYYTQSIGIIINKYNYKMRNSSKSFANQFGITQKNLSSNPSQGIGLNPNLNIEDEYIQNLLKQIHFLNMQIKLVKQKQKENKGMGIMGILNKDSNPVVSHAITSNDKFSQMKNKLGDLVNNAEVDQLRLQDENVAAKAQKDYLERLNLKEQQKNIQNKLYVQKKLSQGIQNLKKLQSKLQQIRTQAKKTNESHQRMKNQLQDLDIKYKSKHLLKDILSNLDKESFTLTEGHHKSNIQNHQLKKGLIDERDKKYRQDPKYIQLTEQNAKLKQKLRESQIQLFNANYQAKQKEELKKLSIRNKDVEGELKKQAGQEMGRLKKKLDDKKIQLQSKLTENKNGLQTNDEIRLAKGKIARKEKQINDLKRKTQISENNYKKLRDDEMRLKIELQLIKNINTKKQKQIDENKIILNEITGLKGKAELQHQQAQNQLTTTQKDLQDARLRLEDLEKKSIALGAKEKHLTEAVDMDQGLRKVKVEKLTNLIQSNLGLNNTINDLMGKWDQIIKFTREPPSG